MRERGVMEKCTYCVQRIRAAEIRSRIEKREIHQGEVVTACQQACPAQAIRFGSLTEHDSAMTALAQASRAATSPCTRPARGRARCTWRASPIPTRS